MNRYDLIILGLLEKNPQHGYDIKMFIEEHELNKWANINVSSIYNRLGWLSKYDFIRGNEEQVGNRPIRNNFTITDKGRELLHQEIRDFLSGFNDDPRTLGLSFLHALPREMALETLAAHIEYLEKEVSRQRRIIREKRKTHPMLHDLSPILSNMSLDHIKVELKYMKAVYEVLENSDSAQQLLDIFDINN
ncbi:PadR family transcriptional regulator [Reinekea sp. G2M2-21]|uniref:PadR family transcriptional regulator n=1 Tax=Reinekea sp. G2M2-21 TaxID=2788942 RepID=UPI0018ABCAB8|nr:PadR family transcriptional regulator [Reinekea sp. G2M2-21]